MIEHDGLSIPTALADLCHRDRVALVVYDMQCGIVGQLPDGQAVTGKVAEVLDMARRRGLRVVFTRHLSLPTRLMGVFQYRQAMAWQKVSDPAQVKPWFLRGSPGFEIVPELQPRDDEAVLDKIAFSAFEGTPLATILRDCGLQGFIIAGIATEIGIEPTVRHGADLGLVPIVVEDACGAGHPDAGRRSLDSLRFLGDAIVTDRGTLDAAFPPR